MSDNEETRLYEAMFVVGANRANQDWGALVEHIHGIITRHGGEVVNSEKWDERKLAYEMAGNTRAVYILIHFNASPSSIEKTRQDFHLSGAIIRTLILRDEDGISSEVKGLSDEPTDPVRSTRRERDVSVPKEETDAPAKAAAPEAKAAAPEATPEPEGDQADADTPEEPQEDSGEEDKAEDAAASAEAPEVTEEPGPEEEQPAPEAAEEAVDAGKPESDGTDAQDAEPVETPPQEGGDQPEGGGPEEKKA